MKTLAIIGRQPAIALAELEALLGSKNIQPLPGGGALLNVAAEDISFSRLGGTIKMASILKTEKTSDWFKLEKTLISLASENEKSVPEGKLTIGISVYGVDVNPRQLERTALSIKKILKSRGRSVRIVPNKAKEISTAQIIHNNLTSENGWELLLFRDGTTTHICRTAHIQDIEAYGARDQERPNRDTRVGMLPPKLAQTIVNLALPDAEAGSTVLDPFCGTGVILQEASLMDFDVYGSDVEPRMVEYTSKNMEWLKDTFHTNVGVRVEKGDATTHTWKPPLKAVASEGYLGLPFAHLPSDAQLQESIQTSNQTAKGFFKNIVTQVEPGFRMCIALPAWHIKNKVINLPCTEQLATLGWKRVEFKHANKKELIYHREDQIVGRELVVVTKI